MFWLCLGYRLIVMNLLIYDLIASEITNVNAPIVIATAGMTEFDKSATMQTTHASENQQPDVSKYSTSRSSTAGKSSDDDDQAELAFFEHMPMRGNSQTSGNKNLSNRNFGTMLMTNENSNKNLSDQHIATARPSDTMGVIMTMTMTDNSSGFTNNISITPTINDSVDNFRNDKKQIASQAAATVVGQNNMKAVTDELRATARIVAATTTMTATGPVTTTALAAELIEVARQPVINTKVITAVKSAATQFATPTETAAEAREAAFVSTAITTTTKPVLPAVSARRTSTGPASRTSTSKASITMSKLPRSTSTTTPTWWPTLHGHDLLSSTNGMPNCRITSAMCACIEKCQATTNSNATTPTPKTSVAFVKPSEAIKSSAKAIAIATSAKATSLPSSLRPSSPATSTLTTKVRAKTSGTEAKVKATTTTAAMQKAITKANQQSWSTTHVTSAGGVKLSPSTNENNSMTFKAHSNKTKFATTTRTATLKSEKSPWKHQAGRPLSMPAAPVQSTASTRPTNLTTTLATTTTTARKLIKIPTKNTTAKSAGALQLHWQRILSRRKRYLAFPEGASFSVSICITVGIIGNPRYNYMSYGLNWGVSYDLPNATWVLNQLHGLSRRPTPVAVVHRRSKRALYERIAEAVQNMGYNGRDCVLRALCESRQYFTRYKMGMIGEMLRVVFSMPKQRLFTRELRENSDIGLYDHAYRKARSVNCATHYKCPFSLLELAFGRYAKPPTNYYDKIGM